MRPQNPCFIRSCPRIVQKILWCCSCDFLALVLFFWLLRKCVANPHPAGRGQMWGIKALLWERPFCFSSMLGSWADHAVCCGCWFSLAFANLSLEGEALQKSMQHFKFSSPDTCWTSSLECRHMSTQFPQCLLSCHSPFGDFSLDLCSFGGV